MSARFLHNIAKPMEDFMSYSSSEAKQFIEDYLRAVSGRPKTKELVAQFVSDPSLAEHIQQAEAAFPGYELIAEQLIAEGDMVAMKGSFRGVQRGPFAGFPPTGKQVTVDLMIFYRLNGGRIVEHWLQMNNAALVEQLAAAA
jgi:predicted ester cyclase